MILNARAVVLSRRNWGESDRLAVLYTETLGRVTARFAGVNKPGRKLKALSEPLVWGEYRLHLNPAHPGAKAIGGDLISSFPALREDLPRTVAALACCELLSALTPERAPNADKYRLVVAALSALDKGANPWVEAAFGLRLLELCGFGIEEKTISAEKRAILRAIQETDFDDLGTIRGQPQDAAAFRDIVWSHAESQAGRPLKCAGFASKLRAPAAAVAREAVC